MNFYVSTKIPTSVYNLARQSLVKSVYRLAGGMDNDPKEIYPFFRQALKNVDGSVLMSGGTRCYKPNGVVQASVAEVVADLAPRMHNLLTLGSFPRTSQFKVDSYGRIWVGHDTTVNFETEHVIAVQIDAEEDHLLKWDGDVEEYIRFMSALRDKEGFKPAIIVWNGGGVTVTETKNAYEAGFTIFVITGSGRAADDQLSVANFCGQNIYHIRKDDPRLLQELLKELGFTR